MLCSSLLYVSLLKYENMNAGVCDKATSWLEPWPPPTAKMAKELQPTLIPHAIQVQ